MKSIPESDFFKRLKSESLQRRIPKEMTFELTYGCNLRCVHCYNPTHKRLPDELTTEEIFRILEEIADLGVLQITFSGGEMFARPDLFDILKKARSLGLLIDLISNATMLDAPKVAALNDLGINSLDISIYGATRETYESVTRVPGSFDKFLLGLQALSRSSCSINLCLPVMTLNVHEIERCRELAAHYQFHFKYCLEIHPQTNGDLSPLAYRLSPENKVAILEQVPSGFKELLNDESCFTKGDFIQCGCGRTSFAITPYGKMNLCVAFPIPAFDLRQGSVTQGWEVLKKTVDQAAPNEHYECPSCDVRLYCRQGRNDAWLETKDMSRCLPHYLSWAKLEKDNYAKLY